MSKKSKIQSSWPGQSATAFGGASSAFGSAHASPLSYVSEPLDLSAINDASVVVIFKNLSKNNENTKSKALEELSRVVEAAGEAELDDAVISSWAQSYPRLSVDLSRRVRQLSHTLHANICAAGKKRMAKYMPQVIGPWLAGTYDNDTTVAKSARSAFSQTFTPDKLKKVWSYYHSAILEYCTNIIQNEQVYTLSDERQTSADDAEGKFARVIGACISSIRHLLIEVPTDIISKEEGQYTELFSNSELWKFSHNSDPFLRKAVYKLLGTCLAKHKGYIEQNLNHLSQHVIVEASSISQVGSVLDYLDVLIITAETYPSAWSLETGKKKKKSPKVVLRKLISKSSQGGQSDFWLKLNHLIEVLPEIVIPTELQDTEEFFNSYVTGINGPQEPRSNAIMSWTSYFGACHRIFSMTATTDETRQQLLDTRILPLYEEYLKQSGKFELRVQGELAKSICVNGLLRLSPEKNTAISSGGKPEDGFAVFRGLFDSLWVKLDEFVQAELNLENNTDKPESYPIGVRWIELISDLYNVLPEDSQSYLKLRNSNQALLEFTIRIIGSKRENTTGFAQLFQKALSITPARVWTDSTVYTAVEDFFSVELPNIHPSPSAPHLFTAILQWFKIDRSPENIEALWTSNIEALLSSPEPTKSITLSTIFTVISKDYQGKIPMVPALTNFITEKARKAIVDDDEEAWKLTKSALKTQGILVPNNTASTLLDSITTRINDIPPETAEHSKPLQYLEYMANHHLHDLVKFAQGTTGKALLGQLIKLEGLLYEGSSGIVSRINQSFAKCIGQPEYRADALNLTSTWSQIILDSVRNYKEDRLSIEYLVEQANTLLRTIPAGHRRDIVMELSFPDAEWPINPNENLQKSQILVLAPAPNVDLINSLSGCVYLVEDKADDVPKIDPSNDLAFGQELRIGFYTLQLLQNPTFVDELGKDQLALLFAKLLIIAEIVKDHTGSQWLSALHMEVSISQFILGTQSVVSRHLNSNGTFFVDDGHSTTDRLGRLLMEWSKGRSTFAFYASRVLNWFLSELVESHGCSRKTSEAFIEKIAPRNNPDVFQSVAFLLGLSRSLADSEIIEKLKNALVSDISGTSKESIPTEPINSTGVPGTCPPKLVVLNSIMRFDEEGPLPLPAQKAMFLLRNVLTWFDVDEDAEDGATGNVNEALISQSAKLLRTLTPIIKDVYGGHWSTICKLVKFGLSNSLGMSPMTYWCLKLLEVLRDNHSKADNDDFEEAYLDSKDEFNALLIRLLETALEHTGDQTESICYDLLCRQIKQIPVSSFPSMGDVYPLLRNVSKSIQETAFNILHEFIPSQQEEISIEAALAKDDGDFEAFLAPELLSLVLEPPTVDKIEDLISEEPGSQSYGEHSEGAIRGYFLAWRLIFDHFDRTAFKVKSAYTSQLQEGGYVDALLTLAFDFLGINIGQVYEPNRESIRSYPITEEDWTNERSIKQLFIHLYYLSLRYTPSLAKSWWLSQKNRQVITGVENLTEKYLSPLIVENELDSVSTWAADQARGAGPASTTPQLQVKISKSVREATASYPVDDQVLSMVIRLPAPFPLLNPVIEGTKKVGFTDNQWKSIQLSSQAVIALQGGSVIDALLLFEKNVSLHFAGVEECAICYSIVGAERTLPNKKCVTCKNGFHAVCLYKWFKSSNSSSCPLCRTGWQFYGGVAH